MIERIEASKSNLRVLFSVTENVYWFASRSSPTGEPGLFTSLPIRCPEIQGYLKVLTFRPIQRHAKPRTSWTLCPKDEEIRIGSWTYSNTCWNLLQIHYVRYANIWNFHYLIILVKFGMNLKMWVKATKYLLQLHILYKSHNYLNRQLSVILIRLDI